MKDSVNRLFQQRFQGHETSVDPGVWQGIQEQLIHSAPAADGVNELFKQRFEGHEAPVDPGVWQAIGSQLGHGSAATISSAAWGWIAASVTAVTISAALYWSGDSPQNEAVVAVAEQSTISQNEAPLQAAAEITEPSEPETTVQVAVAVIPPAEPRAQRSRSNTADPDLSTPPEVIPAPVLEQPISDVPDAQKGSEIVNLIIQDITAKAEEEVKAERVPEPASPQALGPETDTSAEPEPPQKEIPKLFIPNTFTPNGDNINDVYAIGAEGFSSVMMRVYSLKTNQLVFSSNTGEAWSGSGCEDGMYMVAIEARTEDGGTVAEGKVVWLNRSPVN